MRSLVLLATALSLCSCGGYSQYQPPLVDMAGVDVNRYNNDLSQCTAEKKAATFVGNGQYISICMEKKGYKVIERYG